MRSATPRRSPAKRSVYAGVAHHRRVLEPVGPEQSLEIAPVEPVGPAGVRPGGEVEQRGAEARRALGAVEGLEPGDQVGPPALDACLEHHEAVTGHVTG